MTTMKAVRIHSYGGHDVLAYEEAPRPAVTEDDVLIRVHAAGINPVDWKVRAGYLAAWLNHTLPLILGWDVAGVVEAAGANVANVQVGDRVYARADVSHDGAYAEYIAVPASDVVRIPQSLDFIHAAAVPHGALTAWQCLIGAADLAAGQTVLVHGAAGGVGHFAVQLARWRGARVVGTASADNHNFLRQLGVDEAIDYTTTRFEDGVHDIDVVLDTIGGETQERSWAVLKPGGILVSIVQPPSEEIAASYGVRPEFVATQANAGQLAEIGAMIDAGRIKPMVSTTLPLREVGQAHALSESGHARGKIVLQVVG